jgi:hypothetical protein
MAAIPAAGAKLRASVLSSLIPTGWSAWTPTLANMTLGSGTVVARWRQSGNGVNYAADYIFSFTLGAGSAVGTSPTFTLPFTAHSSYPTFGNVGYGELLDSGTAAYIAIGRLTATPAVEIMFGGASDIHTVITATVPFTWTSGDRLLVHGQGIEIA